jgi:hypothetical protein
MIKRQKKEHPPSSIGEYLDSHINFLKYYLTKNVIHIINLGQKDNIPKLGNTTLSGTSPYTKIEDTVFNNMNNIKDKLKKLVEEKYNVTINENMTKAIMYTIIGKIVDRLLIQLFRRELNNAGVNFVKGIFTKKGQLKQYDEIISRLIKKEPTGTVDIDTPLFDMDTGYKINFSKLFDTLMDKFITTDLSKMKPPPDDIYSRLQYANRIMEKEKDPNTKDQYKIVNPNYLNTNELIDQCYKINPDIVDILKSKGANVNHKDAVNATPIFYAIEILNKDLINKLINNGAVVYLPSVKNNANKTPYEYGLQMYHNNNNFLAYKSNKVLERIWDPIYEQIKKTITSKPEYKNNVIRNLDTLFPMMLIIYNNMFYFHMVNYMNNWSFDKTTKIVELANKYNYKVSKDDFITSIPLIDLTEKVIKSSTSTLGTLTEYNKVLDKQIEDYNNKLKDRQNRLSNMKKAYYESYDDVDTKINNINNQIRSILSILQFIIIVLYLLI